MPTEKERLMITFPSRKAKIESFAKAKSLGFQSLNAYIMHLLGHAPLRIGRTTKEKENATDETRS
jgi:hypothetical protein